MAARMEAVAQLPPELSEEERYLLSEALKHTIGSRWAAWRSAAAAGEYEAAIGNEAQAQQAQEFCTHVQQELLEICH
eukprot:9256315-Lingulodinium_polyedra.AAC.1